MTYHLRLLEVYWQALAARMWHNKMTHIKRYLHFCGKIAVSPFTPSVYDLLSFLLYLSSILRSPRAVLNYFSSVKIWVCATPGEHQSFFAHEIAVMKKAS